MHGSRSHRTQVFSVLSLPASLLIAAAGLTVISGCATQPTNAPHAESSDVAGRSVSLPLDLEGREFDPFKAQARATVFIFVRSDCPISNRFAPEIRRLYSAYHASSAEFYLVYVDPDEKADVIRNHLREYKYPCAGLRDPDHALVARCQASITPEAAVFGADHTLTYLGRISDLYEDLGRARAAPTTHELADAIESTLAGKPVLVARTRAVGCTIADLKR